MTLLDMAWAAGKVPPRDMLRAWLIVYIGNFIGATGPAMLVFLSGQYLSGRGAVASVALKLAVDKATEPFDHALFLGILCNVLVCLAVWLALGARTTSDKVLAVLFPVSAFVVAGFEHSVANMYLIPLGLFIKAWGPAQLWAQIGLNSADYAALTWPVFFSSLIPVTIGNIHWRRRAGRRYLLVHLSAAASIGLKPASTNSVSGHSKVYMVAPGATLQLHVACDRVLINVFLLGVVDPHQGLDQLDHTLRIPD